MPTKFTWLVSFLLLIALVIGVWSTKHSPATVTANGDGTVTVNPDIVNLVATRTDLSNSIESAIDNGNTQTSRLISIAKIYAGPNAEIKKSMYQITPQDSGNYLITNAFSI